MGLVTYVDGRFVPKEEASISVFDHGFLYGDGVFEGIRAYNGRVFRLDQHLDRFYDSARALMLTIPLSPEEMRDAILETLRRNNLRDAYIRPVVSRGPGDLGIDPRKCQRPTVVIIVDAIAIHSREAYERGLRVMTSATRKIRPDMLNPRIKSLNYLNNIMARLEANQVAVDEAIMLSADGYVSECTVANIFVVHGSEIWTPPPFLGILKGVTREAVMELTREIGTLTAERVFTIHDVYTADECFITGTGAEVGPIVEVDGRPIGRGRPGPVTRSVMEAFHDLVRREGTPIFPAEGGDGMRPQKEKVSTAEARTAPPARAS